ncbi:hypothetical protein [Psychroserpens sp.]|uniref:hypothetical protein n=1 Tax=Psychroserpens sp. TaxID=2020870 RepID=UPI0039E43218
MRIAKTGKTTIPKRIKALLLVFLFIQYLLDYGLNRVKDGAIVGAPRRERLVKACPDDAL